MNNDHADAVTLACKWAWTHDDRMVDQLLAAPVNTAPEAADYIVDVCLRRKGAERPPHLLLKYAPHVTDDVAERVHETVRDGLRFSPSPTWCLIASHLPHCDKTAQACIWALTLPGLELAACRALVRSDTQPDDLYVALTALTLLVPKSRDATILLARIADQCRQITSGEARLAVKALVERKACSVAYHALRSLAFYFPRETAEENGLLTALMLGNTLSLVEQECPQVPESHAEALIYLRVHGTLPDSAKHLLAHALKNPCAKLRGVYADQLVPIEPCQVPPCPPYDEKYHGVVTFLPHRVQILMGPLARAAQYFRRDTLPASTMTVPYSKETVAAFRDLVYYDTLAEPKLAAKVAQLADMLCATRAAHKAIHELALQHFWQAYDVAKDWPYVRPVLREHAIAQAHVLVRGNRALEIADLIAGI